MTRPSSDVFASNPQAGEVQAWPDFTRGFGLLFDAGGTDGVPSMEQFNGLLNRMSEIDSYILRHGIPEWSNIEDYVLPCVAMHNDAIWLALLPSTNVEPGTSAVTWEKVITITTVQKEQQVQQATAFTSGGTSPTFTLATVPAITSYVANQRFRVKFHAASAVAATLNVNGLGVKNIKQYDATGAKVTAVITAGLLADVEYDGVDFVVLTPLPILSLDTTGRVPRQQLPPSPTVRQTVLSGWVNASGRPDFLLIGAGLSVDIRANPTSAQLVIAFGAGFDQYGQVDHVGITTANVNVPGLAANTTNYLYADYNPVTRAVTFGTTTNAPVYQPNIQLTSGVTTVIPETAFVYYYGGPAQQVLRVFIGEAVTGPAAVTSVVCYAFGARATLTGTALAINSVQAFSHNVGMNIPPSVTLALVCLVANNGYVVGEVVNRWVDGYTGIADSSIACVSDRLVTRVVTGPQANISLPNKAGGAMVASALSNWAPIIRVKREW